jgi:hypothetical protein
MAFIIDNLFFRVEIFRIVSLSLPFIVLLSAVAYSQLRKSLKPIWNVPIIVVIMTILLLSLFVGLWGHNFAPLHIYDPSINYMEVGERNTDFMRVNEFLSKRLTTAEFKIIWADESSSLISLLHPADYEKIRTLSPDNVRELGLHGNELVCVFKNLTVYAYYAGTLSKIKTLEEAEVFRSELYQYLEDNFNRIYNDGKYDFWTSTSRALNST